MVKVISTDADMTDGCFDVLADAAREHFKATFAEHGPSLFITDAGDLSEVYLDSLPAQLRQHHTCSACRDFFRTYGSLVVITEAGQTLPAIWPDTAPALYADAVEAVRRAVSRAKVTGVFLSKEAVWGKPVTGEWTHFSVNSPKVFRSVVESAGQAMAQKREHFGTLSRALAEFRPEHVAQALTLLESDALYRTEKVIGPARFLHGLHASIAAAKGKEAKRNVVWLASSLAPAGFCTPRSGMIGTLLEDIIAGLPFADVKAKFAAKMHPLRYLRPQAEASTGNIKQAEELVQKMGIEPSLHRRFARFEEVTTIWTPAPAAEPEKAGGVFAHLKAKDAKTSHAMQVTPTAITWDKFSKTVLPNALEMRVHMAPLMNFGALVTAMHADAPPIFQWDREDARNPFSWYVYHGGSAPSTWGMVTGEWVPVTGVALQPNMWGDDSEQHGKAAMLILDGAADTRNSDLALFPECLKAELHAIRKTIEQFSKSRSIEGAEEASACGIIVGKATSAHNISVRTALGTAYYYIDRWD
jgi:hypothetical protein